MTAENNIPRNLTNTLFSDFELPEVSSIRPKGKPQQIGKTLNQSKYREDPDDDFMAIELQQKSRIVRKDTEPTGSSNSAESLPSNDTRPPSKMNKRTLGSRNTRKNNRKQPQEPKKEVDIQNEIGEIAEWAEKGVKDNSDEDDFDEAGQVGETVEKQQIRRKLEQKLKTGFGQKNRGGGLAAKAQQLKREKQNKQQPIQSTTRLLTQPKADSKIDKTMALTSDPETSADLLNSRSRKQNIKVMNEESEDDPWDKVNQNTIQHYQDVKEKRKDMNLETVLKYYQEDFQFVQEDIDIEVEVDIPSEDKQIGCMQKICSCFKKEPTKTQNKNNMNIAKRIIAISKKQLSNQQEEYFVLEQLWTRLTLDPFSRYGTHWNLIGFQGRDPGTDLRSTGVLSILQWLLFLEQHPKIGKEYGSWGIQSEFPLALTHIKMTGVFLDLMIKGKLRGQTWGDFQDAYNALALGMLSKVKAKFRGGDNLGTLVEQEARNLKQNYKKQLSRYNAQYKK